jgi:hypothetical protein
VPVGVRVGAWTKTFVVSGDREWSGRGTAARLTAPRPFLSMPITYERAFGGTNPDEDHREKADAYRLNPIGCGYHPAGPTAGARGPNTEEADDPVLVPDGSYRPMSFGPIGRNWAPRVALAGTYDEQWLETGFPFLPSDFNDDYYQAAPRDQQVPYPQGGEEVRLLNLSHEGSQSFRLPRVEASITLAPRYRERERLNPVLDTVVIEPAERRFTLSWRASVPLRRNIFEIDEVVVGAVNDRFVKDRDGLPLPTPTPRTGPSNLQSA